MDRRLLSLSLIALALIAVVVPARPVGADTWKQAIGLREWRFPQDHGAHPDYRTEWWYFTGNLSDSDGHRYGYQLTFFRQGIVQERRLPKSSWSLRDLYLAHFTITDIDEDRFHMSDRISRTGPGLAGSTTMGLNVWLFAWSAKLNAGVINLTATEGDRSIQLELRPRKPVVLHGKTGLSQKGTMPGQASYYASLTDLSTKGVLRVPGRERPTQVRGVSWFDHEFGSNQLSPQQVGWDWFGLHLSDGRDVMLYLLRRQDGSVDMASGTVVEPDGRTKGVEAGDIRIHVSGHWKSPKSEAIYPARWTIRLSKHQIDLELESLMANQELITRGSTDVTYWEGAVAGKGRSMGGTVTCEGYAELTGYAGSLRGTF